MKRLVTFSCVALAALAWSERSEAQDAKGFGSKGQLIVSADRLFPLFSYTSVSVTETNNNVTTTTTDHGSSLVLLFGSEPGIGAVNPHTIPRAAVDFTVIDRLTLGGDVVLGFGLGGSHKVETNNNGTTRSFSNDAPTETVIGFGPRVGYILPLTDILAFWPRGGVSFYSVHTRTVVTDNQGNTQHTDTDTDTIFSLDLDPQLAIVPIPHFFFHAGPLINIPIGGSHKIERTTGNTTESTSDDLSIFHFGLSVGLGGWFDL
jgi:hypothetical protein